MPGPRPQPNAGQPRRAVILTALPVEYEAVKAYLTDCREEPHSKGTVYEVGKFKAPGTLWGILIAEIGPGNPGAAMEAERAISHFKPHVALFVGVAGGLKDVKLGDVVAATKVYGYESGKAGKGFQPRPDIGQSTYRMEQRARAEAKKPDWRERIITPVPDQPSKAYVEPIAAGEKVVADTRSAIYKFLKSHFTDALAVEMEGIGFLTATHACHPIEALIVRGISDLIADKSGADEKECQYAASCHAAAFAFQVLARLDLQDKGEPTKPPRIWNVPHPQNPNFTGRDKLLKDLRESLTKGQVAALTALHGLGGVGKTQLALEYAYRHAPDYDLIWWVRAEDPVALAAEYAALAGPLDLPEKGVADQEAQVAAVRQWLSQKGKWLLIFDNAGEPQDLRGFIPQGGSGHILITSRNPVWRGLARPLDVRVWDRPESVAFLLKRTGRTEAAGEGEKATAGQLADELGDLPLALEQAGAYIEWCGCAIGHYLGLFRSRRQEMLRKGKSSQEYPDTVATTWELSFQKVKAASPTAPDLLNLCAFLAPDDIPKELLVQGAAHLPKSMAAVIQDSVKFDEALALLRRYSLMEVSEEALALHRLVQAVVRDRLDPEDQKKWAEAAVEMINVSFPSDVQSDFGKWPWCARLLPHALAAAVQAQNLRSAPKTAGLLLNQSAIYLWTRAEFNGAKRVIEQAINFAEAAYGPDHPNVASTVNNLGILLRDMGDLESAKAQFERAITIDEKAYGPNHPNVARDVNNLGLVLHDLRDLEEAKAHFERALAIWEKVHGPNHPHVAAAVNNLGSVLQNMGNLPGAKAHYERALSIDETAYGQNHPQVAIRVNNLGTVVRELGDLPGAMAHYKRALAIDEKAYGPNHPRVATDLNNLGAVLWDLRDLPGAKAHVERALAIDEAAYGPNHPQVAIRLNNLGGLLEAQGDLSGAKGCFKRALAIRRQFLGEDHPDTKLVKENLAALG
jgi:tetratricopeptide (TPR) repeat protein/nucleoside phosphorylase